MTDSVATGTDKNFGTFEGMWLLAKPPTGGVACAKVINSQLMIPFSFSGQGKPAGHFYDCHVKDGTLFCRFENFDSAVSEILYLAPGPNQTLTGGKWMKDQIPDAVLKDIFALSVSLPGKQDVVWIRILKTETPSWAEKYFREDWSNKGSF